MVTKDQTMEVQKQEDKEEDVQAKSDIFMASEEKYLNLN